MGNNLSEKKDKIETELKAVKKLVKDGWTVKDSLEFVRDIKKNSSLLSGKDLEFDKLSKKLKKRLMKAMEEEWK